MSAFDAFSNVLYVLLGLSALVLFVTFWVFSLRDKNRKDADGPNSPDA